MPGFFSGSNNLPLYPVINAAPVLAPNPSAATFADPQADSFPLIPPSSGGGSYGTISFVADAQGSGLSATFGTAPAAGDLLIASNINLSAAAGVATGWTAIYSDNANSVEDVVAAWRLADGTSTTYTPFTTTTGNIVIAQFNSTSGWPTNPIDVSSEHQGTSGTPPSMTSTAITPTNAADAAIVFSWANSNTNTAPASISGMTNIVTQSGGSTGNGLCAYQLNIGTSSYSKTVSWTGTAAATPWVGVIAFTPAASGGGTPTYTAAATNKLTAAATFTPNMSAAATNHLTAKASFAPSIVAAALNHLTASSSFAGVIVITAAALNHLTAKASIALGLTGKATNHLTAAAKLTPSIQAAATNKQTAKATIAPSLTAKATNHFTAAAQLVPSLTAKATNHLTAKATMVLSVTFKATNHLVAKATLAPNLVAKALNRWTGASTFTPLIVLTAQAVTHLVASAKITLNLQAKAQNRQVASARLTPTIVAKAVNQLVATAIFAIPSAVVKVTSAMQRIFSYDASMQRSYETDVTMQRTYSNDAEMEKE